MGTAIKCGDVIRLEHAETHRNLHSHLFRAALSGNQEVSAFGESGSGDTGDNWQVICETNSELWMRGKPVNFLHMDTRKYLFSAPNFEFNHQNCGGSCPILHQTEVSAAARKDVKTRWVTDQGVYFPAKDARTDKGNDDDEL